MMDGQYSLKWHSSLPIHYRSLIVKMAGNSILDTNLAGPSPPQLLQSAMSIGSFVRVSEVQFNWSRVYGQ